MTPQERSLIEQVAGQLAAHPLSHKDADADTLIQEQIGSQPELTDPPRSGPNAHHVDRAYQFFRYFVGNLNIFIVGVPRVKVLQIDRCHYIFLRSDSWVDGVLNGEGAGIDSRGCQLWDNLSQS